MPYISTKTTVAISKENEVAITAKLGKAIELIPGKNESWLMLSFEGESNMYFRGKDDMPLAYVEVKIFGKSTKEAYEALTGAVTKILHEELGIPREGIYVRYEEVYHWGYNGTNF